MSEFLPEPYKNITGSEQEIHNKLKTLLGILSVDTDPETNEPINHLDIQCAKIETIQDGFRVTFAGAEPYHAADSLIQTLAHNDIISWEEAENFQSSHAKLENTNSAETCRVDINLKHGGTKILSKKLDKAMEYVLENMASSEELIQEISWQEKIMSEQQKMPDKPIITLH